MFSQWLHQIILATVSGIAGKKHYQQNKMNNAESVWVVNEIWKTCVCEYVCVCMPEIYLMEWTSSITLNFLSLLFCKISSIVHASIQTFYWKCFPYFVISRISIPVYIASLDIITNLMGAPFNGVSKCQPNLLTWKYQKQYSFIFFFLFILHAGSEAHMFLITEALLNTNDARLLKKKSRKKDSTNSKGWIARHANMLKWEPFYVLS